MSKEKCGRTPKYKNADEIKEIIENYFEACKGEQLEDNDGKFIYDKYNQPVWINRKVPTVTGLALALGFTSRQALLNYQAKPEFVDTVTRAKAMVEEYTESRLFDRDGARGAEFSLRCNFRWNAKQSENDSEIEKIAEADKVIIAIRKAAEKQSEESYNEAN